MMVNPPKLAGGRERFVGAFLKSDRSLAGIGRLSLAPAIPMVGESRNEVITTIADLIHKLFNTSLYPLPTGILFPSISTISELKARTLLTAIMKDR
jgi:hypothetical protein